MKTQKLFSSRFLLFSIFVIQGNKKNDLTWIKTKNFSSYIMTYWPAYPYLDFEHISAFLEFRQTDAEICSQGFCLMFESS